MIYWRRRGVGELHCQGRDIAITTLSAAVMDKLLSSPGRPVTCDQLIDHVYGIAPQPEDPKGVVQVTICKLRKMGVPIQSRGRGSCDGYWLKREDIGFKRGDRYIIEGCPGIFTVKQVIDTPVIVFENDALGMEAMKHADDPILKTLRPVV